MDTLKLILVIGLVLLFVIVLNFGLYSMVRGAKDVRIPHDPWKKENQALEELSRRVAELKGNADTGDKTPPQEKSS